ncbi:MAG: HAD-IA family hydrolase [Rhizobiaceae bacterium]|nr:HAD-IA family hydrolase [Rhizobiaceae bacterium]
MKAFIFDVDGTLAETEELHRDAFNAAFAREGLSWHWDFHRYKDLLAVSGGKERIRHFVETENIETAGPLDDLVVRLHQSKTDIYGAMVRGGRLPLRAGVADLVAEAKRRGLRLAIATTTSRENVDTLLGVALGGTDDFEVIACGDMVPKKKPAPDVYLLALRELELGAGDCLAFEDSSNGLRAAKGAGLRCIVTPALYTEDEHFADADLVLTDLRDHAPIFALG